MANTHSLDLERSSSQFASITDASQTGLDLTGDLTFETWVKLESSITSGLAFGITSKADGADGDFAYSFNIENFDGTGPYLAFENSDNGSYANKTTGKVAWSPSNDTWYHLAMTYDASAGAVDFYVDASQQGTTQSGLKTSISNEPSPFEIGRRDGNQHYFDGLIDDLRVWGDIRTSTEISNNYLTELVGNETGLVSNWKFNNDYTDTHSNGNDLTASGSPVFSTDIAFNTATTNYLVYYKRTRFPGIITGV